MDRSIECIDVRLRLQSEEAAASALGLHHTQMMAQILHLTFEALRVAIEGKGDDLPRRRFNDYRRDQFEEDQLFSGTAHAAPSPSGAAVEVQPA